MCVSRIVFLFLLVSVVVCESTSYEGIFDQRGFLYNKAMQESPFAREEELLPLLIPLHIEPGNIIVDAPAGGGYVSWGILNYISPECRSDVTIHQIEPSANFANTGGHGKIENVGTINCPLYDLPQDTSSIDRVSSLAGLHHMTQNEKYSFYEEAYRVLKPGGIFVVADVGVTTPQNPFLNIFIDEYTSTGHEGVFFEENEFKSNFEKIGYVDVKEELVQFHWKFNSFYSMLSFTKNLFGLEKVPSLQVVHENLINFKVNPVVNVLGAHYDWSLRYCQGIKPGSEKEYNSCATTQLTELSNTINLNNIEPSNAFNKIRSKLEVSNWNLNSFGTQGYYNHNNVEDFYMPLKCKPFDTIQGERFPLQLENTNIDINIVSFWSSRLFIYALEKDDISSSIIESLRNLFKDKIFDASEDNSGNCYALQKWKISIHDNEYGILDSVLYPTSLDIIFQDDISDEFSLVDLFQIDLQCSFKDDHFSNCNPPQNVGNWVLLY